ncbi:porin [Thiomicrorhabdus heinhorstiae]|uniref:Porin n=1 Tax=Thiomicrorhabdus heinhorstiae TaxID=2748010 RepID=A0ABS0BXU1_9GAMM|nr:porin [Thiomicrorhabdus heinhorstiae]MBF6058618.1 porin [Thiomicrorhabdus heinhorstiae]
MKKNIVALAIASAIAAPVAMADAPTLFGQINMNINNTTDAGTTVNSTASRIGVKGAEDLGNGLKAVYHLEWEVDVAGGTGAATSTTTLKDRNAFLGLAGGFGTVLMGRHDTPFKMSQPTDLFNDGAADLSPFSGKLGLLGKGGEIRAANVLAYVSPSFAGITFVGAGVSPEAINGKPELTDAYSVAAMYGSSKKGLFLSAAYDSFNSDINGAVQTANGITVTNSSYTDVRVAGQYAAGGLIANVMYQSFDDGDSADAASEGSNIQAQLGYKMGKIMPKIKYSSVDYKTGKDGSAWAAGLNYSLAKKTTAYVYVSQLDENMKNNSLGKDKTSTIVGLLHKF